MADYYPPIMQAVNGLEKSTAETRRAIYDLAREAMLTRLRSLVPALSESKISREQLALEKAISKVETEAQSRSRIPRRSLIDQPDLCPSLRRQPDDHLAQPNSVGGSGPHISPGRRPSMVQPEHTRPHAPAGSSGNEVWTTAMRSLGRSQRKYVALAIMAFIALATTAFGVAKGPELIASFRGGPHLDGARVDAPGGSYTLPKSTERIGFALPASPVSNEDALSAQKAVLYEEDQANAAGKRFSGTAVWRTERISPGAGQEPEIAIRADIEIPEQKIGVGLSFRSNDDAALSASHTVEIRVMLPLNFAHGGISNIPGLLMKQAESTPGVPLAGLAVKVATNLFLINLSSAEADMQRNVQSLKERSWLDIPVVYTDGRRGLIAIEKGPPGARVFSEAFAAWEQ